jgi:cell division protein FtsB
MARDRLAGDINCIRERISQKTATYRKYQKREIKLRHQMKTLEKDIIEYSMRLMAMKHKRRKDKEIKVGVK